MDGFGTEKSGQQYPLFVEQVIHDAAFEQRQHSYDEMSAAERRIQQGLTGAALSLEAARHDHHRQRVIKLTHFCIMNGLMDREVMA